MTTETIQGNKLIAEFMGTEPEVEYCVGHKEKQTICYSPKQTDYFPSAHLQKAECERYLKEQIERYPNGWVTKEGYETLRYEWYPRYHASWDELMPVVEKIESEGYKFQLCRKRATLLNDMTGTTIMYVKAADKLSSAWELAIYAIRHINHLKESCISHHSRTTIT